MVTITDTDAVNSTEYNTTSVNGICGFLSKIENSQKTSGKKAEKWTPSTSNTLERVPSEDAVATVQQSTTMLGFSTFLICVKSVTLLIYFALLIISVILLEISFFYTILAFGIAELLLVIITVYHGFRPRLKVVFTILGCEKALSLVKLVFAIVLMAKDGGKDCSEHDPCSILNTNEAQRFYLFFFILLAAFTDGLIALLTIANSPQMHEFELGHDFIF